MPSGGADPLHPARTDMLICDSSAVRRRLRACYLSDDRIAVPVGADSTRSKPGSASRSAATGMEQPVVVSTRAGKNCMAFMFC
jgi:hypothetical protein